MKHVDLLVQADYLYPMSADLPITVGGEVAVQGSRIVYVGPKQPEGTWNAAQVVTGSGTALLPGFVNCHTHTASLIFRSQTDDGISAEALYTVAFRMEKEITPEEWHDLSLLGCADMIRAGVTTINDLWYSPDVLAEVVEHSGLRANIANKVFDVRMERLYLGDYTRYPAVGEARLREGVRFAEQWRGKANGRIQTRLGTHASDTCDSGLHREARQEATRLGVGMHIHAAQSPREVEYITRMYGKGPVAYLRDIGLLAPDVIVAHLTYADDRDIAAMREAQACYAHCPIIYPRRAAYPRLHTIRAQSIVTGFGTDWMQNDPFEGMRNAINATRLLLGDANHLPTREALWLHTVGAAQALGMENEIGSLEVGKKADMILVSLERPHLLPFYGDYSSLVYYARASDVEASIIDGRVIMLQGSVLGIDEEDTLARIGRRVPGWMSRLSALRNGDNGGRK